MRDEGREEEGKDEGKEKEEEKSNKLVVRYTNTVASANMVIQYYNHCLL